ncbi:hypothetical protein GCM10027271_53320 [Saccharopolyspora gloriosae]
MDGGKRWNIPVRGRFFPIGVPACPDMIASERKDVDMIRCRSSLVRPERTSPIRPSAADM